MEAARRAGALAADDPELPELRRTGPRLPVQPVAAGAQLLPTHAAAEAEAVGHGVHVPGEAPLYPDPARAVAPLAVAALRLHALAVRGAAARARPLDGELDGRGHVQRVAHACAHGRARGRGAGSRAGRAESGRREGVGVEGGGASTAAGAGPGAWPGPLALRRLLVLEGAHVADCGAVAVAVGHPRAAATVGRR